MLLSQSLTAMLFFQFWMLCMHINVSTTLRYIQTNCTELPLTRPLLGALIMMIIMIMICILWNLCVSVHRRRWLWWWFYEICDLCVSVHRRRWLWLWFYEISDLCVSVHRRRWLWWWFYEICDLSFCAPQLVKRFESWPIARSRAGWHTPGCRSTRARWRNTPSASRCARDACNSPDHTSQNYVKNIIFTQALIDGLCGIIICHTARLLKMRLFLHQVVSASMDALQWMGAVRTRVW